MRISVIMFLALVLAGCAGTSEVAVEHDYQFPGNKQGLGE